jgi:thiol:disulfide interchange protein DsbD
VKWSFEAKKTGDKLYELRLSAAVNDPWHIYSQFTPEGGPAPTKISFNKNPLLILQGKTGELGKLTIRHEDVFGVDVKYFAGNVTFIQTIKLRSDVKTNIGGSVEFMTCNDEQCIPPATVNFIVSLH